MSNARNLANLLGTNTTIQTAKIADDAVTAAKIPAGAVAADIADGEITTAKLADDAVTSAKIADGTIATGNIADDAVTGAKIENSPSIADGLTLSDGDLVFASGHGISFAATGDSSGGSMANELLDDYEEGTWTPAYQSTSATFTYGTQSGEYIKIGRVVYVSFRLSLGGSPGGTTTNTTFLTGLPFAIDSTAHYAGSHAGHYFQFNKTDTDEELVYQQQPGDTKFECKMVGDHQGESNLTPAQMNSNAELRSAVVYLAGS